MALQGYGRLRACCRAGVPWLQLAVSAGDEEGPMIGTAKIGTARIGLPAVVGALAAVALSAGAVAATPDCAAIYAQAKQAKQAGALDQLRGLYQDAMAAPSCSTAARRRLGQSIATSFSRAADAALREGKTLDAVEALLQESLTYGRRWEVLARLGDLAADRKQYAEAARRYQESLQVIDDAELTPRAPDTAIIEDVFHKAEQFALLSDDYVAAPKTRGGQPTGLGAAQIRGLVIKKVDLPITFEYDSNEFDGKGAAAAEGLWQSLQAEGMPPVTLVGHTDPRGAEDYNMALSLRRAEAVRSFLTAQGYAGAIEVEGLGESRPFQVDDPSRYSEDEVFRMLRRVEVRRN
jgi:OOP family OmpA-OmpF porin